MRKTVSLVMVFAAFCGMSAELRAAWVLVYTDETLSYYADPATARKTGSVVKLLDMIDYKQTRLIGERHAYLSMQTQSEFDCEQGATRWLHASVHRGNMGSGALVQMASNVDLERQWQTIEPDSLGNIRWRFACLQLRWSPSSVWSY